MDPRLIEFARSTVSYINKLPTFDDIPESVTKETVINEAEFAAKWAINSARIDIMKDIEKNNELVNKLVQENKDMKKEITALNRSITKLTKWPKSK